MSKPKSKEFETLYAFPVEAALADEDVMTFTYEDKCLAMSVEDARKMACWILDITLPPPLVLDDECKAGKSIERARARR